MKKIAVIDLGSNSVRMSIFEVEKDTPKTLSSYRNTIRLSEGMTKDMLLSAEAQLRAVTVLRQYKAIIDGNGIETVFAVATAAVRKAKNRTEFLAAVHDLAGIELRVLDGWQEAALDALAVKRTLGCKSGVICDIGGGSTELCGIDEAGGIRTVSIPVGSRGVSEMFFAEGASSYAVSCATKLIKAKYDEICWLSDFYGTVVAGIGGTLRAVAKFDLGNCGKDTVHSHRISAARMTEIIEKILSSSVDERKKMAGIGKERADTILGGLIFIKCLAEKLSPDSFVVADAGVREGVLFDYLENRGIL